MASEPIRDSYMRWLRAASPALALPLILIAVVQLMASSAWWSSGPEPPGAARYLFLSVAVAAVVIGRNVQRNETSKPPLDLAGLRSLSWRMLVYALSPVTIGAVLAFMTRQIFDFLVMLGVTLVALALLFPRYDQWAAWSASGTDAP